jgi:O-antigen ligase
MSAHVLLDDASATQGLMAAFATAAAVTIALLFLSYWPSYSYLVRGGQSPLVYYMLPGLVALPLAFLQPKSVSALLSEPTVWWFVAFVMLGMGWLLLAQDFPNEAGQQWRRRVLACYFFFTLLLICTVSRMRLVALAIAACLVLAAILNWYDVLYPSVLVPVGFIGANPGRGAGLFINANGAAAFVVMATVAVLPFTPMRLRALLLLLSVIAVAPTFSRFGWIFAALLIVTAIALKLLDRRQVLIIVISVPLLLSAAGVCYELMLRTGDQNILARLAWFQTLGEQQDFSVRERAFVAQRAWERFLDSPLYGHGLGVTLSRGARVGTHNVYVALMAEQGLVGLALYLALIGILIRKGWQLAGRAIDTHARDVGMTMILYAVFLITNGFVNHNVLDDAHSIFIFAFIVAARLRIARTPALRREGTW